MSHPDLVTLRPQGLYCAAGDFYIDPWRPVHRAVVTHGHADHARAGHAAVLCSARGLPVLRTRLGEQQALQDLDWGERLRLGDVTVSLHPASHVLGAAQLRIEGPGGTWVVSGDYRVASDASCDPFEPVRCDVFITESTFGLPIYRWEDDSAVFASINRWWAANAAQDQVSVLMGYSLGKAQRLLSGLDGQIGPVLVHASIEELNLIYRAAGVALLATEPLSRWGSAAQARRDGLARALVLVPPQAVTPALLRRLGGAVTAFASGWMHLRGARRRAGWDSGFALSDHADWPGLQSAIAATGAQRVIVTHGSVSVMVRHLQEQGLQAEAFETEYVPAHEGQDGHEGHGTDDANNASGTAKLLAQGGEA